MKNKTTYEYKAENKKWGGFIYQMNNFDGMLPPRAICDEKEKDDFLEGLHNGKYFFAEDLRKPKYYKIKSKKHINIFTDKNFSNSRRDLVHLQYSKRNDFKNLPYDDFPTQKFNSDLLNIHLVNEKNLIAEGWTLDFYSKKMLGKIEKTKYGNFINNLKYYGHLDKKILSKILEQFGNIIKTNHLQQNTLLTFIPSESKLPNHIATALQENLKIPNENLVTKKETREDAKSQKNFSNWEFAQEKYQVNPPQKKIKNCLIVDDVFGTGLSMFYIASQLKKYFENTYFVCICKDLKR